ncbi:MAG: dihydroorotate dehydrogenase-like protein [Bacteroidales bacterium]|nr:dihydroorotate dehydrogenase-like protein [Bacteroidales bacterium]
MADLTTKYMGLELKNPIIVGACNLATEIRNLKKMEEAGAAAVVYKSLFEEEVHLENLELFERRTEYEERHAEMVTLFPNAKLDPAFPEDHLSNLRKAKESVSIPVIASLNAVYDETWIEYAEKIEETGVDGLELNFYTVPEKFDGEYDDIEKRHIKILLDVKSVISIPVAVKLSPFYSNPLRLISDLDKAGASGMVLFNRLFQPDIDIQTEQHQFPYNLSNPEDIRLPLRFAGLLYQNIKASVCANSGIFSGQDVIKLILAGADCVALVSTLYLNQIDIISTMLKEIEKWMEKKGYQSLGDFRGKLSRKLSENRLPFHRAQYLDFMMGTTEILKKYKIII